MKLDKDEYYYSSERRELVDMLPSFLGRCVVVGGGVGVTLE
jgi:hypothetical protein